MLLINWRNIQFKTFCTKLASNYWKNRIFGNQHLGSHDKRKLTNQLCKKKLQMQATLIICLIYFIIFLWNYVKFLNLRLLAIGNRLPAESRNFSIYFSKTYLENYLLLAIKNINLSNFWVCQVFLLAYDLQDLGRRALWDNWRTELYKFYCIIILTSQNLGEESVSSSAEFKCFYFSSFLKKMLSVQSIFRFPKS